MEEGALKRDLFEKLSWHDLEQWAGGRVLSRGQGYHRDHRVQGLAKTQSGGIVAWVQGGRSMPRRLILKTGS